MNQRLSKSTPQTVLQSLGRTILVFVLLVGLLLGHVSRGMAAEPAGGTDPRNRPLSPKQSLEQFQLHPAVNLELVAAEPDVVDPIAIAFDEEGRLWVVEMRDYPNGPHESESPQSTIRVLRDRDRDGRFETSTVFADQLLFPTGLQPWQGGVIVTLSGEIAYFRDNDGDDRSDSKETWFTGFAEQNPQLRANHPTFAFDHHVYVTNGLRGGEVVAQRKQWSASLQPVPIRGMDFRFDPKSGTYESISGHGQFGLSFDDFGNRFICSNRNPCMHVVLEDRYIKRNRYMTVGSVTHDASPAGGDSRVFALSRAWTTSTLHAGQFTAACGVTIYRGDLLPEEFRGNSFTCEPTGNLVHRDVLQPSGATFSSHPGRDGVEFLATRDEWFRPVNLANGPDGALYVVDMYRAVIEHPDFVPDELKNRPDGYYGNDRGRIYRIIPAQNDRPHDAIKRRAPTNQQRYLSKETGRELVGLLEHTNAWHRETAARLLYERQDKSVCTELEKLVVSGKSPQSRVHALSTLEGLGGLSKPLVRVALDDPDARVRVQALRHAERWLPENPEFRDDVLRLALDAEDARVSFQGMLSAGDLGDDRTATSLAGLIVVDRAADPWIRKAAMTVAASQPAALLERILTNVANTYRWNATGIDDLVREFCGLVGSRQNDTEIRAAVGDLVRIGEIFGEDHNVQRVVLIGLNGLDQGLRRRGKRLARYVAALNEDDRNRVRNFYNAAINLAGTAKTREPLRLEAIASLGHATGERAQRTLLELATTETNQAVRLAAIGSLSANADGRAADALLAEFASHSPAVRSAVLDLLLSNDERTTSLLDAVEAGRLRITEVDPSRVNRLTSHRNPVLRERARGLFAAAIPEDRKIVLEAYGKSLSLAADANRGREIFRKNCAACHRISGIGVDVAPDVADSRTKTPSQLLVSILDPNRAVDNNYFSYAVITTRGTTLSGIVAAETASSITLRQQENKVVDILREDIEEMHSTGLSYMPVGLEKNIDVQQMADLISFIKNWRYLDGQVPIEVQGTLGNGK